MEEKILTGYASIDKPWMKYYKESWIDKPLPQKTLYQMVYDENKNHQSDYVFNYFGNRITYRKFFWNIDNVAKSLLRLSVKPDDIVTIMGLSAPETFYCAYACSKIGAVINLISVLAGEQELINYLNEAKSTVFIALDLYNDKIIKAIPHTSVKTVINMSLAESMPLHIKAAYMLKTKINKYCNIMNWKDFIALSEGQSKVKVYKYKPNRFSFLAHTGGTTGEPKGVMLCDDTLNGIVEEYDYISNAAGRRYGDKYLNGIVPFVLYGFLINAHVPLSLGMENVLVPKVDVHKIAYILLKYKVNFVSVVPPYLAEIPHNNRFVTSDLSFIRVLGAGGDGMTQELEDKLNSILEKQGAPLSLMNGYGLTEVSATACGNFCKHLFKGSVGFPLNRNVISIFDQYTNHELVYNEVGEICINTPYIMLGYFNNPEATSDVVIEHDDGKKWFHTGDIGYISEEGVIYITGRIKRIILTKKDGMVSKIFPDRVEKIIDSNISVNVSCVVQQDTNSAEVKLTAYIVLKEIIQSDNNIIEQELRKVCEAELPDYSRPDKYVFIDKMPLTAAGKIDYRALERMAEEK